MLGFRRETVYEYEHALLWKKGTIERQLESGRHWLWGGSSEIQRFDGRSHIRSVPGQEVLSSDGVTVKASLAVEFRITQPVLAATTQSNVFESVYSGVQIALRESIGAMKIEEFLERRGQIGATILERCAADAERYGVEIVRADIKDVMFPGDLKKTFAQVAAARQEGLAALERARGESAALRNLANAARLIDDQPNLMQLRLLQQIGESESNTFVLGDQSLLAPIRTGRAAS